jgi:hypothetical protein
VMIISCGCGIWSGAMPGVVRCGCASECGGESFSFRTKRAAHPSIYSIPTARLAPAVKNDQFRPQPPPLAPGNQRVKRIGGASFSGFFSNAIILFSIHRRNLLRLTDFD